jgi:hypothetical protein
LAEELIAINDVELATALTVVLPTLNEVVLAINVADEFAMVNVEEFAIALIVEFPTNKPSKPTEPFTVLFAEAEIEELDTVFIVELPINKLVVVSTVLTILLAITTDVEFTKAFTVVLPTFKPTVDIVVFVVEFDIATVVEFAIVFDVVPILSCVVDKLTLPPMFIATEAFDVPVIAIPPVPVINPTTPKVLAMFACRAMLTLLDIVTAFVNVTLPVTATVLLKVALPTKDVLFENAATPVTATLPVNVAFVDSPTSNPFSTLKTELAICYLFD